MMNAVSEVTSCKRTCQLWRETDPENWDKKYVKKKYENQTFRTCQTGNEWQEVREE